MLRRDVPSLKSAGKCLGIGCFQKIPIRILLTVPSLIQIVVVVALIGWLSWWHGQQTVNRLAVQLQNEISERVRLKLETYLATPQFITAINQNAVQLNQLDLNNPPALEQYLFHQLQQFNSVSGILIGTEQGYLRAVNRRGGLHLLKLDPSDQGQVHNYQLNSTGEKTRLVETFLKPDVRQMSWYRAAVQAKRPVWSQIFQTPDNRDLSLNANVPIYDPQTGQLEGVASAGVVVSVIDQFLDSLQISATGLVFIVERNGNLIGTSTDALPYRTIQQNGKVKLSQVSASDSSHPLIRQTAQQLLQQFGDFAQITTPQHLTFSDNGQREYVRVLPYRDSLGLDWLIVVVIPETDFMAQIDHNSRVTVLLCLTAVLIALGLGILASSWIAKPMQQLSQASQAMADGDRNQRVPEVLPIQEIQITAQAFNQMVETLGLSFQQIEVANTTLETQVREQTAQLRQALEFEDLLRRITEKVRDSLDEAQILQTVVRELALELGLQGCDVALYNLETRTSTVYYEYLCADYPKAEGKSMAMDRVPELYQQLLQRQYAQFCLTQPLLRDVCEDARFACLACPVTDDQGVLGDLWLFKSHQWWFNPEEIRLVQQVANQCAIALRQSRLYQMAQAQVKELEHLHRIKDDFLSTVSHELRTPMANIKMATQLLEMSLERIGLTEATAESVFRYLQILKDEGQREITLINNLLDLSRLDAGTEPYVPTTIDPKTWIPHVVEPFVERAQLQHQQLQLELAPELPPLTTDLSDLERILSELLNNACKYTPAGEQIVVTASIVETASAKPAARSTEVPRRPEADPGPANGASPTFLISVTNSGTEISEDEQERIFDKFYRIPSTDPWKHGGTGLGLALVKGLVEKLNGEIHVESHSGHTTFMIQLPMARGAGHIKSG